MHQKRIIEKIASVLEATEDKQVDCFVSKINYANRIFLAGAGRSGLVARFFAMRLMHTFHRVYVVGEVITPAIQSGDLLVVVSGSGSTSTLLPLVNKARSVGATTVVVSMKSRSPMGELADFVCQIGSNDEEVFEPVHGMPMGTVFELSSLIFLEATIAKIVHEKGLAEEQMRAVHSNLE